MQPPTAFTKNGSSGTPSGKEGLPSGTQGMLTARECGFVDVMIRIRITGHPSCIEQRIRDCINDVNECSGRDKDNSPKQIHPVDLHTASPLRLLKVLDLRIGDATVRAL